MKILYDHGIFTYQKYGGISKYFVELITELNAIYPDLNTKTGSLITYNEHLLNSNIREYQRLLKYPFQGRGFKIIQKKVNNFFQKNVLSFEPDIIHQTFYYKGSIQYTSCKYKIVNTVHDLTMEKFPKLFKNAELNIFLRRKAIENSDRLIVISKTTKDDLLEYYKVPEEKIKVIYHGVRDSQTSFIQFGLKNEPYILFVGERRLYKNFEFLLNAYSILKKNKKYSSLKLYCVGGDSFTVREISSFSNKGLFKDILHFQLPENELNQFYKNAICLVYPSIYEGFGLPILEAMINHCKVICSDIPVFREIGKIHCSYFNLNDIDSLIQLLEKFVDDKPIANYTEAYLYAKTFVWKNTAMSTHEVYNSLI